MENKREAEIGCDISSNIFKVMADEMMANRKELEELGVRPFNFSLSIIATFVTTYLCEFVPTEDRITCWNIIKDLVCRLVDSESLANYGKDPLT